MQQAVGKDVAAFRVRTELDFIDGQKRDRHVQRHGFDGADPVTGVAGDDLFFTGDQRDLGDALFLNDFVVIFPGEKAKGKTNHSGGMAQHTLDGQVGFSGIGGAEYRSHRPVIVCTSHGGDLCRPGYTLPMESAHNLMTGE